MPQQQMPHFPALEKLAANGFLSVETWNNKRAMLNFKATAKVPMLGTMIESCGDTLDESHMPLGWPLSIDGAVRQFCMHKHATIEDLNDMLAEFNLQRSSEINGNTTLWSHNSAWNKKYMDPYPGHTLQQLWDASEHYICRKASKSREIPEGTNSKWSGDCNTSNGPALPTTYLSDAWADRSTSKPPTERSPDAKGLGGVGTNDMRK